MSKQKGKSHKAENVQQQRNRYDQDEVLETPFSFEHLKRSGTYIARHKKGMIQALIFSIISSLCGLTTPMILRYVLDNTVPNKNYKELAFFTVLTVILIVISIFLIKARAQRVTIIGQEIIYDIRSDLFTHMQKLPFTYYDDRPHGKILVRVVQYVNNISNMLSNGIIDFFLQIFNLVFIVIFMLMVDVSLTFVVLAGLPVLFVVLFAIRRPQRKAWQMDSNKHSNMNAYLHESVNGMMVSQSFVREETNQGIFNRLADDSRFARIKAVFISNFVWFSVDNVSQIVGAALYVVGLLVLAPAVSFGTITAMSSYSWRFWQPINRLSQIYNDFINTIAYLERIFEMMDEPVSIGDKEGAYEMPPMVGEVEFDHVTFGYEAGSNILENINFTIKPGQSIAFVGPTGAGKTTIVNLISRFYDVTDGHLRIDGHSISDVTIHSLRSQMGSMLQDSFIFSGTVSDNVRYGKLDATDAEIRAACKAVYADRFIDKMPKGYETVLSEGGDGLSEGQKQLLSMARTLIRDPKILILDEATSAIDTKTEQYIQASINYILQGRTSFIIAHRLSTIQNCDIIMYVKNKGISEAGSHEELLALKGDYYDLHMSQLEEM